MLLIIGIILAGVWFYKWLYANYDCFETRGVKHTKQNFIDTFKVMTARDKSIADLVEMMYNISPDKYDRNINL